MSRYRASVFPGFVEDLGERIWRGGLGVLLQEKNQFLPYIKCLFVGFFNLFVVVLCLLFYHSFPLGLFWVSVVMWRLSIVGLRPIDVVLRLFFTSF